MSDDFVRADLPEDWDEESIEKYVEQAVKK